MRVGWCRWKWRKEFMINCWYIYSYYHHYNTTLHLMISFGVVMFEMFSGPLLPYWNSHTQSLLLPHNFSVWCRLFHFVHFKRYIHHIIPSFLTFHPFSHSFTHSWIIPSFPFSPPFTHSFTLNSPIHPLFPRPHPLCFLVWMRILPPGHQPNKLLIIWIYWPPGLWISTNRRYHHKRENSYIQVSRRVIEGVGVWVGGWWSVWGSNQFNISLYISHHKRA